ncbi:CDAN1-interacting nuclease 1 [Bactrocera dorsalis]|uniref:CDAN1-interacting nuclease 1 n=1 Tax=Bactrocera dorsalis TaxID=27457 RepID=A0A9B2GMU3_BACDO|nr:CDAN1-interacting nuclease 1 [Bactrocera dorsalis]
MEINTTNQVATEKRKKRILTALEYSSICNFIQHYHGLAIDCEMEMVNRIFTDIDRQTLKSILQTELSTRLRAQHWQNEMKAKKYLKTFKDQVSTHPAPTLLLKIACLEGMSPMALCRTVLQEKYKFLHKADLSRLLKYPHLIDDPKLAANVIQCMCSDSQDGPLVDLRRRILGEEYEFKLKEMATAANMHYYDENDLRRLGYDKTPDIKMIVPFLYKGEVVNWIESKANFGDVKTHKWYIQQQLYSYSNRFGAGIVIYWFGYHEDTPRLPDNNIGIIVLDDFPSSDHMVFLNICDDANPTTEIATESSLQKCKS